MKHSDKFIVLDRDGTIIRDVRYGYKINEIEFLPYAMEGLLRMQAQGFRMIVVSNQAGIARGYYTASDADKFNNEILRQLSVKGIHIEKIYYCPHHPEFTGPCQCRKPNTALATQAAREYGFEASQAVYIGDKDSDIKFGQNCKGITILIQNGQYTITGTPDYRVNNLLEAANIIISL